MKTPLHYAELIRDKACQSTYVYSVGSGRVIIEEAMLDSYKAGIEAALNIINPKNKEYLKVLALWEDPITIQDLFPNEPTTSAPAN